MPTPTRPTVGSNHAILNATASLELHGRALLARLSNSPFWGPRRLPGLRSRSMTKPLAPDALAQLFFDAHTY